MRLLEKSQIIQVKSSERKMEIDEGVKLAKKIDTLRETAAKEETNLARFRDSSLKVIKNEINDLVLKRDGLITEVETLESRRRDALVPLDKEWIKVNARHEELKEIANGFVIQSAGLKQKEDALGLREELLVSEEKRAADIKRLTSQSFTKATDNEKQTEEILKETKNERSRVLNGLEERVNQIIKREASVAVREREVKLVTESNEEIAKLLNLKEIQINDKYATLQRTLEQIKNKK